MGNVTKETNRAHARRGNAAARGNRIATTASVFIDIQPGDGIQDGAVISDSSASILLGWGAAGPQGFLNWRGFAACQAGPIPFAAP